MDPATLRALLRPALIAPRRLLLDTGPVEATAPMLRGVWGAALHDTDPVVYESVFTGTGPAHQRVPAYLVRPAPADPAYAPAIEWITWGVALAHDVLLLDAWTTCCKRGLGPDRIPADLRAVYPLHPDGAPGPATTALCPWSLDQAFWPLDGPPEATPCVLIFDVPLRLLRKGKLITQPGLTDIVVAGLRRLAAFMPPSAAAALVDQTPRCIEIARTLPAEPWDGEPFDLVRYSGRQKRQLDLHGVAGRLALSKGPGPLWPLLAALQWTHLGKSVAVGLGQPHIQPLS